MYLFCIKTLSEVVKEMTHGSVVGSMMALTVQVQRVLIQPTVVNYVKRNVHLSRKEQRNFSNVM